MKFAVKSVVIFCFMRVINIAFYTVSDKWISPTNSAQCHVFIQRIMEKNDATALNRSPQKVLTTKRCAEK